jgi:hypothetical protein
MTNIKFTYSGGETIINLDQVSQIKLASSTSISFYMNNSAYAFSFATADETAEILEKIKKISNIVDLDKLAQQ